MWIWILREASDSHFKIGFLVSGIDSLSFIHSFCIMLVTWLQAAKGVFVILSLDQPIYTHGGKAENYYHS